ncbi:MAG: hypothetical protein WCC89_01150 [Candidatus Sulfotelmatobacter sp.]
MRGKSFRCHPDRSGAKRAQWRDLLFFPPPTLTWDGHFDCHPEAAESHAKRATPNEGTYAVDCASAHARSEIGKGTTSVVPQEGQKNAGFSP